MDVGAWMKSESRVSSDSFPTSEDFTTSRYADLLCLAKASYVPREFSNYALGEKFFLLRHDVDISLNRALALARIEEQLDISASYLINVHSTFYNIAERNQADILGQILDLGHTLGLHFDASFYDIRNDDELILRLQQEAAWLELLTGARPEVMSFHNPSRRHLDWNADRYGDLINCYSKSLMESVPYISDSNGYWRFRQLHEVVMEASEPCLQILIHPGWWQDRAMSPRQRLFRASYGRAVSTMRDNDSLLSDMKRVNLDGMPEELGYLRKLNSAKFALIDYLWNEGHVATLFLELWRLHEMQLNKLCQVRFRKQWRIPAHEVNALFASHGVSLDGWRLFEVAFGQPWAAAIGIESMEHRKWVEVRNQLIHGREAFPPMELQRGCSYLATIVTALASWGLQQPFRYDGLAPLGSIGLPTVATAEGSLIEELDEGVASNGRGICPRRLIEWEQLKARLVDGQTAPSQP